VVAIGPIVYWNRAEKREQTEQVYGDTGIKLLYGTWPGQKLADVLLSGRLTSQLYGAFQASSLSRGKIAPFIKAFQIPMDEYEDPGFKSFNDFFIREFKPGCRVFVSQPGRMPAFAEARYLAYERIEAEQVFPVKGKHMTAQAPRRPLAHGCPSSRAGRCCLRVFARSITTAITIPTLAGRLRTIGSKASFTQSTPPRYATRARFSRPTSAWFRFWRHAISASSRTSRSAR